MNNNDYTDFYPSEYLIAFCHIDYMRCNNFIYMLKFKRTTEENKLTLEEELKSAVYIIDLGKKIEQYTLHEMNQILNN